MKKLIWISFDLGVRGDFDGMYEFLDRYGAKECGDSIGFLRYEFKGDLVAEITDELKTTLKLDRRSRLYLIFPDKSGKYIGRFLFGNRKAPPWSGFGPGGGPEEDVSG